MDLPPWLPPPDRMISHYLLLSVAALVYSESIRLHWGHIIFKCNASLAFLLAGAYNATARRGIDVLSYDSLAQPAHRFPALMLLGLALSVVGDVLLIPARAIYYQQAPTGKEGDSVRFKAGTLFFALAHVAYVAAFLADAGLAGVRWVHFLSTLKFGAVIIYWLGILDRTPARGAWFAVPQDMWGLVFAYVLIIWTMVATATATDTGVHKITGGWMFMVSDLFVAADVFGKKEKPRPGAKRGRGRAGWKARSVGWAAYFGAQYILAHCI